MHAFVFSLERSAAAKASILKANGIKELYPHVYYNCHTMNFIFSLLTNPTRTSNVAYKPYRSSLCATVAKQHHRWARAAIEEPDVAKAMYENISSISFYFIFATLQVISSQPRTRLSP